MPHCSRAGSTSSPVRQGRRASRRQPVLQPRARTRGAPQDRAAWGSPSPARRVRRRSWKAISNERWLPG